MEGSYISTGPGPHGQAVGLFKCVSKNPFGAPFSKYMSVRFEDKDGFGNLFKLMSPEDAEYYTVGTVYLINATTP
jgi:hypothetical protein